MTYGTLVLAGLVIALTAGMALIIVGRTLRRRRGLGSGTTVALDNVTLTSRRHGLTGRMDRLIRDQGKLVPEEWKSASTIRPWHRAQMGVYFLLIEDQLRVKPSHGFIVCGDGTRHQIENTAELRASVLDIAAKIRRARKDVNLPLSARPRAGQCLPCGMRNHCRQAKL